MVKNIGEKVRRIAEQRAWRRFLRLYRQLVKKHVGNAPTTKAHLIKYLGAWSEDDARKKVDTIIGYVAHTERTRIVISLLNPNHEDKFKALRFDNLQIDLYKPKPSYLPRCTIAVEREKLEAMREVLGKVRGERLASAKYTYERVDADKLHRFMAQYSGLPRYKSAVAITRWIMEQLKWVYVHGNNGEVAFYRRIVRK